jgi:two-component system, response regulator YesN
MYKLVIVDDEEVVREGLRQFVDWKAMNFCVVACFEDGRDAISYLKQHEVDVVLTDIEMASVNGVEVARYVYDHHPGTKTVIVSGHKQFEYARKAIEYNVHHYLIKPTKVDEINTVFEKIQQELQQEQKKKAAIREHQLRNSDLKALLQEQFVLYVTSGAIISEKDLAHRLQALDLPIDPSDHRCCLIEADIQIDHGKGDQDIHVRRKKDQTKIDQGSLNADQHDLKNIVQKFCQGENQGTYYLPVFVADKMLEILSVSSTQSTPEMEQSIEQYVQDIKHSMQQVLGWNMSVQKGSIFDSLIKLSEYNRPSFTLNNDENIGHTSIATTEYRRFIQQYKQFIPFIIEGEEEKVQRILQRIIEQVQDLPLSDVQRLMIDLCAMITHTFVEQGVELSKISKDTVIYHTILSMKEIDEIEKWSSDWLYDLIRYYRETNQKNHTHQLIERAKQYVHHHYERDIHLEKVADYVYLNSVYFSRLFKQHTGRNFTEYLTHIRIEKAIELLKQNKYKTYEIGQKVGYKNSKYFSRVFKQQTGYTPKAYSRHILHKHDLLPEKVSYE